MAESPGINGLGWFSAAGMLLQMWGGIQQGRMARIHGERQRQAAEFAKWQADRQANTAIAISQRQAVEEHRQASHVASRALAVAAASGGGVSDPTMVRIIANARGEGTYRANVALYEGEARARQLEFQGITGMVGGFDAEAEGAARQQGYNYSALGMGLQGGASLYAKYGMRGPSAQPSMGDNTLIGDFPSGNPVA